MVVWRFVHSNSISNRIFSSFLKFHSNLQIPFENNTKNLQIGHLPSQLQTDINSNQNVVPLFSDCKNVCKKARRRHSPKDLEFWNVHFDRFQLHSAGYFEWFRLSILLTSKHNLFWSVLVFLKPKLTFNGSLYLGSLV